MNFMYEVKTSKPFVTAIDDMIEELSIRDFGVLYQLNFKEKIESKGMDFSGNFEVLEVCNPKQAKEVLEKRIEVGYFLPCKVVVYEKEDDVYIGLMKPTVLIDLLEDNDLITIAKEVESILVDAVEAAR